MLPIASKSIIFLSIAVLATSCGGNSTEDTTADSISFSGVVIDDYLQNALVCVDMNTNGNCDTDEPTAYTGTQGEYTISDVATSVATQYPILVVTTPGTTLDNGNEISGKYKLKAPAGKTIITPLTTIAQYAIENNPAIDESMAASAVEKSLGLVGTADVDIYADYLDTENTASISTKNKLHGVSKVIARTVGNNLTDIETEATNAAETDVNNETLRIALKHVSDKLSTIAENVYSDADNIVEDSEADTYATNFGGTYNGTFTRDLVNQKAVSKLDKATSVQSVMEAGVGSLDTTEGYAVDFFSLAPNNKHVDQVYELNLDGTSWDGPFYQSTRFKLDDTDNWVEIDEENNPYHRTTQTWQFNADGSGTLTQTNPDHPDQMIDRTKVTASTVNLQGEKLVDFISSWATDYETCLTNNGNAAATFTDTNSNAIRWTWVTEAGGYILQPESSYGTPTVKDDSVTPSPFADIDDMTNGSIVSLIHNNQYLRLNNDPEKTVQFYGTDSTGTTLVAASNWEKVTKGSIEILIVAKPLAVYYDLPIGDATHLLFSADPVTGNVSFGGHTPSGTAEIVDWWEFNKAAINEYLTGCGFNPLP